MNRSQFVYKIRIVPIGLVDDPHFRWIFVDVVRLALCKNKRRLDTRSA
jgi:hypothetical protein